MRILALIKPDSGVDYHRITQPLKYLELKEGDSIMQISNKQYLTKDLFEDKTVVLFSRECPFNLDQILEFKKEIGFKIIVDIDDYWHLPTEHPIYESWKQLNTSEQILKSITSADVVTTTHEYLRDKISKHNDNVYVIENALPYGKEQFTIDKVDLNNILYSCGASHLPDIKELSRFFELCKNNGDIQKYQLCVAGFNGKNKDSFDLWNKIEKEGQKFGNYKRWYSLPLDSYMNHYKYAKVCIAPLKDSEFNKCKSFLKGLEAGCKNIPLLASAIHPYTEIPVVHCKTQRDWYNNLKELIKNPGLCEEKGKVLGEYVKQNFNLELINKKRKLLYEQA